jgi:non-ribosomal peptide synthetase component F
VQYADYAAWQRAALDGDGLDRQLGYWRRQLAGAPAGLDPARSAAAEGKRAAGASHSFAVEAGVHRELIRLARAEGATLFMVLLAAYQALLAHWTGRDDLTVGSPVANRGRTETEEMVGFFLNTLVLRGDLSGDPTFRELLDRVRRTALDAYAHQDVPFERLVAELRPSRSLDHSPLFQVWLVLQNAPEETLELPGLSLRPMEVSTGEVRHDLKLDLTETDDGLHGFFQYRTGLVDAAGAARLADGLRRVLARVVAEPDVRLSELRRALGEADDERRARVGGEFESSRHQELRKLARRPGRGARRSGRTAAVAELAGATPSRDEDTNRDV